MTNATIETPLDKWFAGLLDPDAPDEFETKQLLRERSIPVPRGLRLLPGDDLDATGLTPPLVAKVCSGRILHKTDEKGVLLNLEGDGIAAAVADLRDRFPGKPLLVEEQVRMTGPEFIVGALIDPGFGPAVMVGTGGVLTELYGDVSFRLAPCSAVHARNMLAELTVWPVFSGFRGFTADADGLAGIIQRVGDLAVSLGVRFSQLDINPIVDVDGVWTALDAKLVLVG